VFALIYLTHTLAPKRTFYELLSGGGAPLAKAVYVLLAAYFTLRLFFVVKNTDEYIFSNLYDTLSWAPFTLPIIIGAGYAAFHGLRAIARTTELLGVILTALIIIGLIFAAAGADARQAFPLFEFGASRMLKGLWDYVFTAGDILILVMFLGKITPGRKSKRAMLLGIGTGITITLVYNFCFVAFYGGLSSFVKQGHAMSDIIQSFIGSDGLLRMDVFVNLGWMVAALIKICLLMWAAASAAGEVLHTDRSPAGKLIPIVAVAAIVFALFYTVSDTALFDYLYTGPFKFAMLPVLIITVTLAPILGKIYSGREGKGEKNGNS
jgi:hypothetical protein